MELLETKELNISKEELNKKIEESKKRIEELNSMKEEVEISLTDPDSKHMQTNNKGTDICHNVQIAVDNKNDIVVAVDVTSLPADQTQLYNISSKAKEEMKVEELTVLADKGYWNGENLKECKSNNITTIVSKPKEQGNRGYKKSDIKYDKEKDVYICPNGAELHRRGIKEIKYSNTKACKNCLNREKCTSNKRGKIIVVNENEAILQENVKIQLEKMDLYKTRQMIVEHVFGTVKRALGYTHFLLRGNKKVKGESFMHFLIYNMKRLLNIKNIEEILKTIKG